MFEKQKAYIEENKDNKMVRAAEIIGGFVIAYAGVYLFQHGISPALSDRSTLKATIHNLIKNNPLSRNSNEN
jgi:hypothetical protein